MTTSRLTDASRATTRLVSLNVGLRVANGTLRILSSPRPKHGSLPLPGASNSVFWSVLLAATKTSAHRSSVSLQPERHARISSSRARSLARRMEDPALLIVLPPPASLVLCRPPALARTTYLWKVLWTIAAAGGTAFSIGPFGFFSTRSPDLAPPANFVGSKTDAAKCPPRANTTAHGLASSRSVFSARTALSASSVRLFLPSRSRTHRHTA